MRIALSGLLVALAVVVTPVSLAESSTPRRDLIERIMRDEYGVEDGFIFRSGKARPHEWRSWCWSFHLSQFRWVESWRIAQDRLRKAGVDFDAWSVPGGAIIQVHRSQFQEK